MTRQRLKQLRNIELGLCGYCSSHRHPDSKSYCWYHLVKTRVRQRLANGYKPGHKTGRGRKAITRTPQPASDLQG